MTAREKILSDGDTFAHEGLRFIVSIEDDNDQPAPWDREDGHGPVTDWLGRDKKPGELVLASDGYRHRFYDLSEAQKIALRDGWGIDAERRAEIETATGRKMTAKEIAAHAVESDFKFLRDWCNDGWRYVGVCVRHVSQDEDERYSYALWGIETCDEEYITQTAYDMARECGEDIRAEIHAQREALKTTRTMARALIGDIRASAALRPAICAAVRAQLAALMGQRSAAHARIAELTA